MGWHPTHLPVGVPKHFDLFVRTQVDTHLHDVHCMLRLPIHALELHSNQNFSATQVLLSVVAGLSTVLYSGGLKGAEGRFKNLVISFFPWDEEPVVAGPLEPPGVPPRRPSAATAANILYDELRNPLAH